MCLSLCNLLVFTFIFHGFIHKGHGFEFISALKSAIKTGENLVEGVFENVEKLMQQFKYVNEVVDATVQEYCIYRCPNRAAPKPNRNHKPSANGCGALGLNIKSEYLPVSEMTKCCDQHDICYDTCGNDKEKCDMEFRRCLYKHCDSYEKSLGGGTMVKACKAAAKVLYTGTLTFGCKAYLDAQSKACFCPSYGWKDKRNMYTGSDHQEL